jgi:threonine/homoserine/homoserine lactone efflux protein
MPLTIPDEAIPAPFRKHVEALLLIASGLTTIWMGVKMLQKGKAEPTADTGPQSNTQPAVQRGPLPA